MKKPNRAKVNSGKSPVRKVQSSPSTDPKVVIYDIIQKGMGGNKVVGSAKTLKGAMNSVKRRTTMGEDQSFEYSYRRRK